MIPNNTKYQAAVSSAADVRIASSSSTGSARTLRDTTQSGRVLGPKRGALAQELNEM
jgi:hypothetical protein